MSLRYYTPDKFMYEAIRLFQNEKASLSKMEVNVGLVIQQCMFFI